MRKDSSPTFRQIVMAASNLVLHMGTTDNRFGRKRPLLGFEKCVAGDQRACVTDHDGDIDAFGHQPEYHPRREYPTTSFHSEISASTAPAPAGTATSCFQANKLRKNVSMAPDKPMVHPPRAPIINPPRMGAMIQARLSADVAAPSARPTSVGSTDLLIQRGERFREPVSQAGQNACPVWPGIVLPGSVGRYCGLKPSSLQRRHTSSCGSDSFSSVLP